MKKILRSMLAMMIAAFTLASCSDVPSPYGLFTSGDEGLEGATGTGTLDDPFNVPGVLNYIKTLPAGTQSDVVYVKGIVSALVDGQNYDAGFGNGTFFISADGNAKNQFEVYRALYLENQPYVDGPIANLGDEVIICGKVTMHGSTPETVDKDAYLYSINGTTHYDARIFGTAEEPLSVADALTIINGLENGETIGKGYVKGIVCQAPSNISAGKLTYYISDDGKSSNSLQVYKGLGLNQAKFSAVSDLAVGDEVVIFGPMTRYSNGNPELNDGNYLISLKKGEGGGGGEETTPTGDGTQSKPYNVAAALNAVKNLTWTSKTDYQSTDNVYVKGKISRIDNNGTYTAGGTFGNASFHISDDGQEANEFYCFRVLYLDNTKFNEYTGEKVDIKVGDEVVIYGKLMNYHGNTPETVSGAAHLYSLNASEGGGEQGGGEQGGDATQMTKSVNDLTVTFTTTGVSEGNTVTYDLTTCGLEHQAANPSFTLNGVNFSFEKNTGNNNAIYWKTGDYNEFRLYAQNKLVITGTANIAKVEFTCTKNGSNNATGNAQSYATVSGKTFTFVNDWTAASSGTQCRIKTIKITYAK